MHPCVAPYLVIEFARDDRQAIAGDGALANRCAVAPGDGEAHRFGDLQVILITEIRSYPRRRHDRQRYGRQHLDAIQFLDGQSTVEDLDRHLHQFLARRQ